MKTNFERITESPEKLATFILNQYGFSQVRENEMYFNLLQWLGWDNYPKEVETEDCNCNTCKHLVNGNCDLDAEGCQTEMYECYEPCVL